MTISELHFFTKNEISRFLPTFQGNIKTMVLIRNTLDSTGQINRQEFNQAIREEMRYRAEQYDARLNASLQCINKGR